MSLRILPVWLAGDELLAQLAAACAASLLHIGVARRPDVAAHGPSRTQRSRSPSPRARRRLRAKQSTASQLPRYPPQFAARTPLHHTDSVCSGIQWLRSMYRESVGVRAPSLCGLQQSTGDVLLATVHRHTANRPTSHPHHVAMPSLSLQWNRPPLASGSWEIPIQFAFRQMRQQPRQTRHEQQQA